MTHTLVYIVGAGPGDPQLITVRGHQALMRANVVVYDRKVPASLLDVAPADAERIDVGAAAPKPLDQDAISYLVAEKAREGRIVVRLKWGDPFVFDSGGKEAIFLHEQGIPFEVISGVPLAIAGPAYAGVPLTYPDAGDAVVFIRGNESESDAPARVDWEHVAGVKGTLVCYAGARQIGAIARALVGHGRPAGEAAVLVFDATTVDQQTLQTTLGELAQQAPGERPGLLIVGAVAGLRDHLRWFDTRPLFGRRVVVTRSRDQASELAVLLESAGAEVISLPTIRILPPPDPAAVDSACDSVEKFDWLVFTSANGVEHFMSRFIARRDIRDLKGVRICAVGPATAAAVEQHGVRVDLIPPEYRSDAIVAAVSARGTPAGQRFLLARAQIARERLAEDLREAGAEVVELAVYHTVAAGEAAANDIYRMLLDRRIDAVTFTSASTVRHFAQVIGEDQAADLLQSTVVAAIGPVTAEAAQQLGITASVVPSEYTIPALVDALADHFRQQSAAATAHS